MRTMDGYKKGVNLGGWLSQYDARDTEHFDSFITEDDIRNISSFGLDHIRVPVDYELFQTEDGAVDEQGYHYLDNCISWCRKYGLKMVLDLHRTYGYTFDPLEKNGDKEIFFHDASMQQRFFDIWNSFAERYAQNSDMMAFELLNEIISENVIEEWNEIADKAIKVIRKVSPDMMIIIGGVCYNHVTHVADLRPPVDDRIVYNFHCYEPHMFTHQRAYWMDWMPSDITVEYPQPMSVYRSQLEALGAEDNTGLRDDAQGEDIFEEMFDCAIKAAEKNNAPLYCGEYGVIDQAPLDGTLRWLQDIHAVFERHGISRALWNYKGKDFGLIDDHYAPIFSEMKELL